LTKNSSGDFGAVSCLLTDVRTDHGDRALRGVAVGLRNTALPVCQIFARKHQTIQRLLMKILASSPCVVVVIIIIIIIIIITIILIIRNTALPCTPISARKH
jgi:hypothetical protein